jgi:hypothetical protein
MKGSRLDEVGTGGLRTKVCGEANMVAEVGGRNRGGWGGTRVENCLCVEVGRACEEVF